MHSSHSTLTNLIKVFGLLAVLLLAPLAWAAPTITSQSHSGTVVVNYGSSVTMSVVASGSGTLTYQWYRFDDMVAIPGATSPSYTDPFVQELGSRAIYLVRVTDSTGSVDSSTIFLVGNNAPAPAIASQPTPASQSVSSGTTVTYTFTFTGPISNVTLSALTSPGGAAVSRFGFTKTKGSTGVHTATAKIDSPTLADAGSYVFKVEQSGVTSSNNTTTPVTLSVSAIAPTITRQPGSANLFVPSTGNYLIGVTATGSELNYQWMKDGVDIPNSNAFAINIAPITLEDAGSYTVRVFNTAGSVTSNAAVITVNVLAAPSIVTQPVSQSVVLGNQASFIVSTVNNSQAAFQWMKDGVDISGATSRDYTIPAVSAGSAGSYTVRAFNAAGTVTSNAAVLTVLIPPAITTQPVGQTITVGASASFSVSATGTAPLTYQWKKDGIDITGATSATYSLPSTTTGSAGSYTVVVTNTAGTVTSNAAVLVVNDVAAAITTQPASQSAYVGSSATFSVVATGTNLTYQWFRNGISISGATAASYTINPVSSASAGSYTVTVSNNRGNVTSSAATLSVLPVFTAPAADGYAASVTGGGTATTTNHTVVTTAADFRTLAESTAASASVITVSGTLNLGSTKVAVKSNKTIQGLDGSAALVGNLELASGVSNVVIRGLNISNTAGDGITLTGASNVYITHVTFFDCSGPLLRIVGGSDNVTVSWCEFYFSTATGTRQALLIGAATGETKALRVTLDHNWFTDRVDQQQPDSTWGQVHAYNNYFNPNGTANTSGSIARANAQFLSERNQYTSIVSPLTKTGGGLIRAIGNAYTTTTGTAADAGTDTVFTPPYSYRLLPVTSVASQIAASAGNTTGAGSTSGSTGSSTINASGTAITTGSSFTLNSVTPISSTVAYQWRLNNADIAGATSATYTVASAQASNAGTYTVVSSNSAGDSLVSSPVTITVGAAPSNPPAGGGGGGGGSPSLWFFAALASLAGLRHLTRKG